MTNNRDNFQIFISFCSADRELKNELKEKHLTPIVDEYRNQGVTVDICEMDTHCAGDWSEWTISAVKKSDIVVCIMTKNVFHPQDGVEKVVHTELDVARENGIDRVPIIFDKITDKYKGHLAGVSCVYGDLSDVHSAFARAIQSVKILLDRKIKGETTRSAESDLIGYAIPKAPKTFVGRENEMAQMREELQKNNLLILQGPGGMGKTTLASKFFEENPDIFDKGYIIDARSGIKQTIQTMFSSYNEDVRDPERKYRNNIALLKCYSGKTIIVFDNYDNEYEEDSRVIAELEQMQCRFLVTSRIGIENCSVLNLDRMGDDDLIALVQKHYPDAKKFTDKQISTLKDFFNNVEGLTIAVELASALMRDGDIELKELNNAIMKCNEKVRTGRTGSRATAFDHLSTLYEYAKLTEAGNRILDAVCHISPSVGIERKELKTLLNLDSNEEINNLITKTFLRMDESNVVSMHALMSDVYYEKDKVYEKDNADILEYILQKEFKQDETTPYDSALRKLIESLAFATEKRSKSFDKDKITLASCRNDIGIAYSDLGDYTKALECYEKALEIMEVIYADTPNHPDLAMSYNNIGNACCKLGDHSTALKYHEKALEIYEIAYADTSNLLGWADIYATKDAIYSDLGDYAKALEYRLKALEIREMIYADTPNHPHLAMSYNNIGATYSDLGDHSKALKYHEKALEIHNVAYADAPNLPSRAVIYNNIGNARYSLGDHSEALKCFLKALEIYEIVYADTPNHPDLAMIYNNIGNARYSLGDHSEALEFWSKAYIIYKAINTNGQYDTEIRILEMILEMLTGNN